MRHTHVVRKRFLHHTWTRSNALATVLSLDVFLLAVFLVISCLCACLAVAVDTPRGLPCAARTLEATVLRLDGNVPRPFSSSGVGTIPTGHAARTPFAPLGKQTVD